MCVWQSVWAGRNAQTAVALLAAALASLVLLASPASEVHAESGSCYTQSQLADPFLRQMLADLEREGKVVRLPDGRIYLDLENLPNATICDLPEPLRKGLELQTDAATQD